MNEVQKLNIDTLKELQNVLSQKIEITAKIAELPASLATKRELINRINQNYVENNKRCEQIKEELTTARTELEETEKSREQSEMRMDRINTQREYEMLDKEIKAISEKEVTIKEHIENLNSELAQYQERLEKDTELIKIEEEELQMEEGGVKKNIAQLKTTLEQLNKEEQQITPLFDEEFIYKFQRIIKSLEGEGIVPLVNNVCSNCHMLLPYSFANTVRENKKIVFCPYCSKILYYSAEEGSGNDSESYADIIESFDEEMIPDIDLDEAFDDEILDTSDDEPMDSTANEDMLHEEEEEEDDSENDQDNIVNEDTTEEDDFSYEEESADTFNDSADTHKK